MFNIPALLGESVGSYAEETFKGLFYELSPLTITLAVLVIVQNSVVAWDNFKQREKLAPALFTVIAVGDILFAQGVIIVTLISILVNKEVLPQEALYKAVFYFMMTGLPGITCSRFYNVVLSVSLSINLADPFRVLDTGAIKLCIIAATALIACLHISDAIFCAVILDTQLRFSHWSAIETLATLEEVPGVLSAMILYCRPLQDGTSKCALEFEKTATPYVVAVLVVDYALPVVTVLVCMVIQARILFLRYSEMQDTIYRRAAITVLMVSTLFFLCHISWVVVFVFWVAYFGNADKSAHMRPFTNTEQGEFLALLQLVLPLTNSVLYPLILILRKPDLRERYLGHLRRVSSLFSFRRQETDTEHIVPPLEQPPQQTSEKSPEELTDQPLQQPVAT